MNETDEAITDLMSDLIESVECLTLLLFAAGGAIVGHVLTDLLQPETLPYTEPHHEFLSNDDKDCVAWDFSTVNAHIIICEDEPPILVQKKQSKGLRL